MFQRIRLVALLLLILGGPLAAADSAPLTATQIARLESLCRVFGVVKFFHPWLAAPPDGKSIDWDAALTEAIPLVEKAATANEFRAAIAKLLSALDDHATRVLPAGEAQPTTSEPRLPATKIVETSGQRILVIDATHWPHLAANPNAPSGGIFATAFAQAADCEAIVLDLRPRPAELAALDASEIAARLYSSLRAAAASLLKADLKLAMRRTRYHYGYVSDLDPDGSGYKSGFLTSPYEVLKATPGRLAGKRLVVLASTVSPDGITLLTALQSSGQAVILQDGPTDAQFPAGATFSLALADDVAVSIRTADLLNADATIGLVPDMILARSHETDDALTKTALAIASGEAVPPKRAAPRRPAPFRRQAENRYAAMTSPSREYRLLGLFRVWNVMHYFFPYQSLLDRSWDSVLTEFVPRFAQAEGPVAYGLTVMELLTQLQDSHVYPNGGPVAAARARIAEAQPLLAVRPVRGEFVITAVHESLQDQVHVGDAVLAVDGEPVEQRVGKIKKYFASSTPQALENLLSYQILGGPAQDPARLQLENASGEVREVALPRLSGQDGQERLYKFWDSLHRKTPVFAVLPEGFGYFDLTRLTTDQVQPAFEAVKQTTALILDLRGYPQGTAFAITERLTERPIVTARFRYPYWTSPNPAGAPEQKSDQNIEPGSLWKYTGRIVALINEQAISQSEHSCLCFEQAAQGRITFLGTPTQGANGNTTSTVLPGGIYTYFTGMDVRHADGRQLQRVGIQPNIRVEPTQAGIAAGQDEVLAAAIKFLNDSTKQDAKRD